MHLPGGVGEYDNESRGPTGKGPDGNCFTASCSSTGCAARDRERNRRTAERSIPRPVAGRVRPSADMARPSTVVGRRNREHAMAGSMRKRFFSSRMIACGVVVLNGTDDAAPRAGPRARRHGASRTDVVPAERFASGTASFFRGKLSPRVRPLRGGEEASPHPGYSVRRLHTATIPRILRPAPRRASVSNAGSPGPLAGLSADRKDGGLLTTDAERPGSVFPGMEWTWPKSSSRFDFNRC